MTETGDGWIVMRVVPWSGMSVHGVPMTKSPIPGSVGLLLAFASREAAAEWAGENWGGPEHGPGPALMEYQLKGAP